MWWESFTNWLNQFFNEPVVISITTVLSSAVVIFTAISKTSVGQRAIIRLTKLFNNIKKTAEETLAKVVDVETLAKKEIDALKVEYEKKTSALVSIVNFYEESVFAILEEIPNAKVQAKIDAYKQEYEGVKKEISELVEFTYQEYTEKVKEIQIEIEKEKDEKIAYLTDKINKLEEIINSTLNKVEEGTNEQENEQIEETTKESNSN